MTCKDCNHFFVCDEHIDDEDHVERKCSAFDCKPPCKVGDVLWYVPQTEDFEIFCEIEPRGYSSLRVNDVGVRYIFFSSYDPSEDDVGEAIPIDQIVVTLFYTEEEAKRAANERRNQ